MVEMRVQAEELDVQHVGHPGQGMPIGGVTCRKCPRYRVRADAVLNMEIMRYVFTVVQADEIRLSDRPECYEGKKRQKKADQGGLPIS